MTTAITGAECHVPSEELRMSEEKLAQERLIEVLRVVPRGTLLLCGLAVSTLLLAWLAVYVFLFLARGFVN